MSYIKLIKELLSLRKNTTRSSQQIAKLQEKKLRHLLRYAYNYSSYYKMTFSKAGINEKNIGTASLSAFPTINKRELIQHFDELVTVKNVTQEAIRDFDDNNTKKELFDNKYHIVHSSGSTDKPSYFLYDKNAWGTMLGGIVRAAFWDMSLKEIIKYLGSTPRIVYIAATDGRYGGAMAVGDGVSGMRAQQIFVDINAPLAQWKEKVADFKPNMIIGYPSAIKILGELVENGEVEAKVFRVVTCGEPLSANHRQYFGEVFDAKVINIYGASESLAIGIETEKSNGIYLFDDLNVVEVVDGEMYLTSLYNLAQPLIRYHISDRLTLKEKDDYYPFSKINNIVGRDEDLLWFEKENGDKEFLHPLAVEGFCINGMMDYQFKRTSDKSFEIDIETSSGADKTFIKSEMEQQIAQLFVDKELTDVKFSINFVSEILSDPKTGKKRLTVS